MSYCVTAVRLAPDFGFASASRHTAEGARELAMRFIGDGLREVEVRDDQGNLLSSHELARAARTAGAEGIDWPDAAPRAPY